MISLHTRYKAILALLAIPQIVSAQQGIDPKSHQQFADNLTSLLYSNSNECSSALGVSMAFSLLYPGSTNEGIPQIRDTFNYPSNNLQLVWQDTTQQLQSSASGKCISEFNGVCNSYAPTLQIANSIWIHNQCDDSGLFCLHTLNSTYDNVVGEYAIQTDFESNESPMLVNEWVENSTNGLITSIVDESKPLFPPYVLIAINSIYLKARWLDQFSDYTTTLDTFYNSPSRDKKQSEAHFMHTLNYYDYSHSVLNGYQIIKLPFAESSSLSMIFVLPQAADEELKEVTSTELITSLDDSLVSTRIALALPKFKFESTYDDNLKESLMQLGVVAPFTGNALCGIFDTETYDNCESLIIDKIIQKTVIDVNEKGVEAAAVTAAMATPTSMGPPITDVPIKMILDHPFQFFIYDSDVELVLFEGRLGEPELPEDEPEVQLFDGEHSDSEFWSSTFGVDPIDPSKYVETEEDVDGVGNTTSTSDPIICPDGRESIPDTFCGRGLNRADCVEGQFCHIHPTDVFAVCCLNPVDDGGESTAPLASEVQTLTSEEATTNSTSELAPMDAAGQQAFADELTPLIYTIGNDCSSALGVSMALSLVYPGSTGDGIDQLRDTLRYPNGTNMRLIWEDTTTRMLNNSDGECLWESMGECASSKPLLQIANSVWFDDGDTLNAEYDTVVGEYAMQTDFEAAESPIIVNDWVENSTNGLIDSIVDESKPLFQPYVLLAINSIYLKATWLEQFEKRNTNLDSFYDSVSKSAAEVGKAHFMNNVDYFGYSHDAIPGYQVIDLPFDNSQMSMIFVLPKTDGAEPVTSTDVISASSSLQNTRVALSLPKFKFESKYEDELKDALFQLGIVAPFTEGSGALCSIFEETEGCENLIIDKVIQKTVIDVNEEGVEAAAVTMVGVSLTSIGPPPEDPVLMMLNHPFQFFIYDKDEELMLFEGRVSNPGLPEDEPEMQLLDASHSDSDFWSSNFYVDPVDPPASADTTTVSTVTNEVVVPTEPPSPSEVSSTPATQPETDTSSTNLPITSSPTDQPVDTSVAGNDKSSKTFASICTSIFLVYALAHV